ncbi:MAG: DUF1499 domain-containing protein [Synechococcales cyanobacterium SupBloom_Metag_052]|nr:DUF1499 domain-containing protein [Synechococcales cyanobacterium SupBloom_Metag_052]
MVAQAPVLLRRFLVLVLLPLLLLLAPAGVQASLLHLEGPVPVDLGVQAGSLAPCASSAHCARASWPVADPAGALASLGHLLGEQEGLAIQEQTASYIHATATSRLFGFVDDLELYADQAGGRLQARSISRLGDSDLGVNGRRLDQLGASLGHG